MELQPGLVDSAVALLAAAAAQLTAAAAGGSMFAGDSSARKQQQQHCQSTATSLAGALANICSSPTGAAHVAAALSKEQLHALVAVMLQQPPSNGANGVAKGQSEDAKQQAQQLQQLQKHLLGLLYNLIGSHQQKEKKAGAAGQQEQQQQQQAEAVPQAQSQGQSPQQQQQQQFLQQQAGQPMVSPRDKPSKSLLSIFSKGGGSPARGASGGGVDAQEAPKPAAAAAAAAAVADPIGEVTSALRAISGQQPALLVRLQQLAGLGQAAADEAGGQQGPANGKEAKGSASSDEQARVQILLRVLRA
jgi:hypothetical protein